MTEPERSSSPSLHVGMLPDVEASSLVDDLARVEQLGFDGVWIADSQSVFRDAYTILALLADRTERIVLAPGVANPVTRHPAALACTMATLDEISGGRAVFGIGVGESAVRTLGKRPARLAEMRRYIATVRSLWSGETVEFEGHQLSMPWAKRSIPVVVASSGPRSMQLAGAVADGVMFQVGADPNLVSWAIDNIRRGAVAAGRDPDGVDLYMRVACAVAEDAETAVAAIRGYAATAAQTMYNSAPVDLLPEAARRDLARLVSEYDYYEHASRDARHVGLVTKQVADVVAVAGTPEQVVTRLNELASLGVGTFVVPVPGDRTTEMLESLSRHVIPGLARTRS